MQIIRKLWLWVRIFIAEFLKTIFSKTTEAVHRYQTHDVQLGLNEFPDAMKKPNFRSSNETMDEHGNVFREISSLKTSITDDRPVHVGGNFLIKFLKHYKVVMHY